MISALLITVSIALAILRIGGVKGQTFQAVAHLYVGGLIGAWLTGWDNEHLWNAVLLSVIETVCGALHLVRRHRGEV